MSVINTNYLSLVAQNNLTKSQNTLGSAIERLSSGLRINSAKDDAAGQAIANRFTANIKGLAQASRNANDGISLAQTTEGALNEINNNLQRVRELTVQAVNGTNNSGDRTSIQDEISQRMAEIDRISSQTQFNGTKVLADGVSKMTIQVGANDGDTIDINLKAVNTTSLDLNKFNVGATSSAITEFKTTDATTGVVTTAKVDLSGVTGIPGGGAVSLHGYNVDAGTGKYQNYAVADKDGNMYDIGAVSNVVEATGVVTSAFADAAALTAAKGVYDAASAAGTAGTSNPLKALDDALAQVDSMRSELGAVQNRFQSTIANLNNTVNNLSSARSRIEDADYATEVSNMGKAQILQQAGTSVLAQANQVPQTVLSLLR